MGNVCAAVGAMSVRLRRVEKPQSFMFLRHTRENENGAVIGLFGFDTVLKPRISQIIHRLAQIIRGSPQGSEQ